MLWQIWCRKHLWIFFHGQNITSLPYSDHQASICEEYANLSFNNPSKINIENFKILNYATPSKMNTIKCFKTSAIIRICKLFNTRKSWLMSYRPSLLCWLSQSSHYSNTEQFISRHFANLGANNSVRNLQSSPLIIQSMRDLTWYLAHPPMLYIFLDCFILFLPHIFSAFVITSLPSAREAAMTKIKKNSVQSHQYQRTTIYMIPNHLHYIVIQELLLKISLVCISSACTPFERLQYYY